MSETLNIIVRMSIYHTNYALFITYADLNPETLRVGEPHKPRQLTPPVPDLFEAIYF